MNRVSAWMLASGLAAFVSSIWMASARPVERSPRPDRPVEAAQFRYQQRLSADGTLPDNALARALRQRKELLAAQSANPQDSGVYPGGFTWLGPGNVGGRIRAIVINPADPNVIYVGSASGGIWKTTNGGTLWAPLDDFMPTLSVGCMAMSPANPNVLYAGTGEGFFETVEGSSNTAAVRGAGVFKTTDGGATWNQIPSTANSDWYFVNRLAIDPGNAQHMLAATATGIYRSLDGGTSWAKTFNGYVYDVRFHPTDGAKAVAGLHEDGGLYTLDGGQTWIAATGLVGHRAELCYAPSNPTIVYATISENDAIKTYRSTNGGQTYALRTTGSGISTYSAYNNCVWVDPANSDRLILGGVSLYRSTNGGQSQAATYGAVHSDMHAIVTHPGYNGTTNRTVYFGTDGGIYRTTDSTGSSATALNNNLGITQFYGAKMNPISGKVIAGAQDNGTKVFSGNPQAWTTVAGGDGGICDTDPTDANFMYGEIQWAYVFRSIDGGVNANYIFNGPNPIVGAGTTLFNFIPHLTLDPNNSNRMYVGGRLLWRSNNVKATTVDWSSCKGSIEPPSDKGGGKGGRGAHFAPNPPWNISTVTVAPGNSNLVWVGYNNGQIWKSTNALNASPDWTRLDDDAGPLPDRWVSKIYIDPADNNRVYVSFMGWEDGNLWRTTDGGTTWTDIGGLAPFRLPSMPISVISKHPTQPGWLYAGSDIGLFFSADDGQTWTTSNAGPGIVPVEEIHWIGTSRMFLVTHGRGVYQADLDDPEIPFSPDSYELLSGAYVSGRLQEMYASDDRRLVFQSNGLRGRMFVDATSPVANPSYLRIRIESQSDFATSLALSLYKPGANTFEKITTKKLAPSDLAHTVEFTVDATRFIDPATHKIRANLQWSQRPGTALAKYAIDQILFTVRQ